MPADANHIMVLLLAGLGIVLVFGVGELFVTVICPVGVIVHMALSRDRYYQDNVMAVLKD